MIGTVWLIAVFGVAAVFIGVSVYRIVTLARLPLHLRWELAPVPRSRKAQVEYMAAEILLLRGVWQRNRGLWPLSYALHAGIYLLFLTLLLVIIDAALLLLVAPAGGRGLFEGVAAWPALAAYVLGGSGSLGLIIKRSLDNDLRPFSTFGSYFNLALLAAIFISGACGWFLGPAFFRDLGMFARGLVTPAGAAAPGIALALHAALFLVFMLYLPLSDMFHFAAKFFTYHEVRWDERPLTARMEKKLAVQVSRPASWAAPHVAPGKSRAVTATGERRDAEKA